MQGPSTPGSKTLGLRLPADIHAAVKAQAEADDRTMNGQIVRLLRLALAQTAEAERLPARVR